jgi:hypothetical protein
VQQMAVSAQHFADWILAQAVSIQDGRPIQAIEPRNRLSEKEWMIRSRKFLKKHPLQDFFTADW